MDTAEPGAALMDTAEPGAARMGTVEPSAGLPAPAPAACTSTELKTCDAYTQLLQTAYLLIVQLERRLFVPLPVSTSHRARWGMRGLPDPKKRMLLPSAGSGSGPKFQGVVDLVEAAICLGDGDLIDSVVNRVAATCKYDVLGVRTDDAATARRTRCMAQSKCAAVKEVDAVGDSAQRSHLEQGSHLEQVITERWGTLNMDGQIAVLRMLRWTPGALWQPIGCDRCACVPYDR